ncbi:hypothetical protein M422DRAFT_242638 [Sphaerobolus stellatus SS14]|nr:hypothetical protein M422DRAFT_242638 [Sphaerobolus stellatus SS14]
MREQYPLIAKGKQNNNHKDPQMDSLDEETYPHHRQPSNWLGDNINEESMNDQCTKHALSKVQAKLSAKTAILEWLYADNAPANHLNPAAAAARGTYIPLSETSRIDERWKYPMKPLSEIIEKDEYPSKT